MITCSILSHSNYDSERRRKFLFITVLDIIIGKMSSLDHQCPSVDIYQITSSLAV